VLVEITRISFDAVLYEVVSAFATVGLSTGITGTLPPAGQLVLVALMFIGRLGPISLVSALALRERHRLFHVPEGRPLIG
jgi:Trk-type K+ transport system membrane component